MYNIVRNDTAAITVRIKEQEQGDIVRLSYDYFSGDENIKLNTLRFTLFYDDRREFAVFGIAFFPDGSTGNDGANLPITIIDENKGLIELRLTREQTKVLDRGYYFGRATAIITDYGNQREYSFPDFGLTMGIITD